METTSGWRRKSGAAAWSLTSLILALVMILSACGPDASQAQAAHSRARLDAELQHARQLGIPAASLKPIETQEKNVAAGDGGWGYSYQNAGSNYDQLYNQLLGVEQQSVDILRHQALQNVQAFQAALNARRAQGFIEVTAYQGRLDKAFQDLSAATTAGEYGKVADFALSQTQALTAMGPAYQELGVFHKTLDTLQGAGIDTAVAQIEYQADLATFRDAASPTRYEHLSLVIDGQINQLVADQTEALPYVGAAVLSTFQARVDLLRTFGEDTGPFQRQHDVFAQELSSAKTLADYVTLSQAINRANEQMTTPLERGQARHDLSILKALVDQTEAMNPLLAYEYADPNRGIGDVTNQFNNASSPYWSQYCDYSCVDGHITNLTVNLRALLDNLRDPTPVSQAHQTDLELMRYYGIMGGQVTMVSLREQAARMYQNGKLVMWTYVTTGRFERPSVPGLHYAETKQTHIEFQPTEPIGSPIRGYPTPINYAIYYADYGFFMHDGWWRTSFGPGTNLPHWDPAAFNGGSHGCINVPLANMATFYGWVQLYSPIVVY
jgi:hypothetical protein